jgi:hypothetical protein
MIEGKAGGGGGGGVFGFLKQGPSNLLGEAEKLAEEAKKAAKEAEEMAKSGISNSNPL